MTPSPPFEVESELPGWELVWAHLDGTAAQPAALPGRLREVEIAARAELSLEGLAAEPVIAALRRLFRAAGCDPTRYRASSEALLRRVLKGEELPAIHPLVDLNNAFSVATRLPACVLAEGAFTPPVVFRAGRQGESYDSLRGPLDLAGKPLLADVRGPFGTPITDSRRVKVEAATQEAWLVAYLPAGTLAAGAAIARLGALAAGTGITVD